ncbi:acyltransferase [Prevotella sp. RM4]|uniref:acyltransferase family protein n=1 Tax=Prevotella sp. RM4 TaxID=1200547 RepID=UPI0006895DC8|nr:acyltransferase [Prevotella sp. RM4]
MKIIANGRNAGIDILKFLAVLLITNSHMEPLYGEYSKLATGGAIGDALFFFCSGFTLLMKPMSSAGGFLNWYKRRINRIYPTVFAVAIISCLIWDHHFDIISIIVEGGGWFVQCIMVYYILLYFIGYYLKQKVLWIISLTSLACFIWYFLMGGDVSGGVYGWGYFRWLVFLNFMLLGAYMGSEEKNMKERERNFVKDFAFAFGGIIIFYMFFIFLPQNESLRFLEVFSFIPLLVAVYYLYHWGNNPKMNKLLNHPQIYFLIRFIGGLCLEIYLIQGYFLTDLFNMIFPLNLLMIFLVIVISAYVTRCLARTLSQTCKDEPYDIKKIVALF